MAKATASRIPDYFGEGGRLATSAADALVQSAYAHDCRDADILLPGLHEADIAHAIALGAPVRLVFYLNGHRVPDHETTVLEAVQRYAPAGLLQRAQRSYALASGGGGTGTGRSRRRDGPGQHRAPQRPAAGQSRD
jgi:hypothetical protein